MYPEKQIIFNDSIKILDFPVNNKVNMEITGRIDLKFDRYMNYGKIKETNKQKFEDSLPKVRFYWNNPMLNIYLGAKFRDEITMPGVEIKSKKFIEIISVLSEKLEL